MAFLYLIEGKVVRKERRPKFLILTAGTQRELHQKKWISHRIAQGMVKEKV